MTINYTNISSYSISYTAATVIDVYTAPSDTTMISCQATGLLAAGCTLELQVTDTSNNVLGYIIPPSTTLSQNNGFTVSDKIVLQTGQKIRMICSVAATSTPMKFLVSLVEGVS